MENAYHALDKEGVFRLAYDEGDSITLVGAVRRMPEMRKRTHKVEECLNKADAVQDPADDNANEHGPHPMNAL